MVFFTPNETWRGSPFVAGKRYRVIAPGKSWDGQLAVGEVLTYQWSNYGHYFGVSVYVFLNQQGEERTWALYDDDEIEMWSDVFVPVDEGIER